MELVDGQPLSALLRGGRPLDPEVVRDLMAQAADAIGAAHRAGIVHRDVKPANLLVTPDRQIKITDFGIARASDGLGLTATGQVMGTPQYLSPEQARGATATPASDVYSLGVVAFECLAGHRPFDADSPVATALAHLNDPVPDLPPEVPADLAAVVRRAMAKDAGQRYADGDALRRRAARPGGRRRHGVRPDAAAAARRPSTPRCSTCRRRRRRWPTPSRPTDDRRSPWLVVLLVLALVAAIILIIVVATRRTTATTTRPPPTPAARRRRPRPPPRTPRARSRAPRRPRCRSTRPTTSAATSTWSRPSCAPRGSRSTPSRSTTRVTRRPTRSRPSAPTTGLVEGDTVTVEYYREAEPTSEPPTSEPTSEPPSTEPTSAAAVRRRHPTPRTPRPRRRPSRPAGRAPRPDPEEQEHVTR